MKSTLFFLLAIFGLLLAVQADTPADDCCSKAFGKCSTCQPTKRDIARGVTSLPRQFVETLRQKRNIMRLGDQVEA